MGDRPHIDHYVLERIAQLVDGDSWALADFLVDEFPPDRFGNAEHGTNTGLRAALEDAEDGLRLEYGIEYKATTLSRYRATAIAWPDGTRVPSAPFVVHKMIRGANREQEMARYLKRNKGRPLTERAVQRFRADDRPKAPVPWDVAARKRIESTVRTILAVTAKRDDWWETANPKARTQVAAMLTELARDIRP